LIVVVVPPAWPVPVMAAAVVVSLKLQAFSRAPHSGAVPAAPAPAI
jgi:hypothetical protein